MPITSAPGAGSGDLVKLDEQVGTGASGVLEFSSIPATYRHLEIWLVGRSDTAGTGGSSVRMTFEASPTAGAYDYDQIVGTNTTVAGSENVGANDYVFCGRVPSDGADANVIGASHIRLPEYAGGAFKTAWCDVNAMLNLASGFLEIRMVGGIWESTAPISLVRLTLAAGSWTTASRATLYGLSG